MLSDLKKELLVKLQTICNYPAKASHPGLHYVTWLGNHYNGQSQLPKLVGNVVGSINLSTKSGHNHQQLPREHCLVHKSISDSGTESYLSVLSGLHQKSVCIQHLLVVHLA
jgi:hypothetical protein